MKIRKNEQRCVKGTQKAVLLAAALLLLWGNPIVSRADAKGVVIPNSVNIRKMPEQGSEVIGSSAAGKEIDIKGQVESDGIVWYQVYVDGNTMGYVRADMIERKGDETIPTVSAAQDNSSAQPADEGGEAGQETPSQPAVSEGGAKVDAQEAMDPQYATTNVQAKVRPDPSTSNPHVDSLTPGTQVVVSGKSEGSDSKTWYYVTFTGGNGSEKTGFIRSDLLDLGDLLPVEAPPEEAPVETPSEAPAEPVRNDYELKIETDSEGVETWYLYDNIKGEKEKLQQLLESRSSQSVDDGKKTGSIVKQRVAIVVLAVLSAILAVVVVILAFKLRDVYYEDDDEEEADERRTSRRESAERDERRTSRREGAQRDERRTPRREGTEPGVKRRSAGTGERPAGSRAEAGEFRGRESRSREDDRQESRRREVSYREDEAAGAVSPAPRRKSKNFLLDDDEFEFEFLNMDDKDLK